MAGRIPQTFVDDLLARVDIVELIGEHVTLKRAGHDFQGLCPFHDERTPSFTVSPRKQFYHCFGCGAHGSAIGFLMQHARLEFPEAVRELARRTGLSMPDDAEGGAGRAADTAPLYEVLGRAAAYFRRQLAEQPAGGRASSYLQGRGLGPAILEAYGVGYAPPGWDNLVGALGGGGKGVDLLVRAGLAIPRSGGRPYDRFRDRVMFPIQDRRGRTVGFGGRVLDDGKPKYLNSPETPVFHKGREVYGLYQAQQAQQARQGLEQVVLVEGYVDVVALAQAGIGDAVATLGTAATAQHLDQLFRAAPEVVFCFDGDPAGRKAAWRALETALPLLRDGRQASFVFLPEGDDPDTLVRRLGREGFEAQLRSRVPLSVFLFDQLSRRVDASTLDGRARLVELARPLLGQIPGGAFRRLLEKRLGELTQLESGELAGMMGGSPPRASAPAPTTPVAAAPSLVRRAVTLLLHHPELVGSAGDPSLLRPLDLPGVPLLVDLLELLRGRPGLTLGGILEHFRGSESGHHLERLAGQPDPALPGADLAAELRGALERLERRVDEQRFRALREGGRAGTLTDAEMREYAELSTRVGRRLPET
jgi:DNA primase